MAKQRINRRQAAYRQLNAAFPLAFPLEDAEIRPLALSIRDELAAWAAGQGLDERAALQLSRALQQHCCRRTYQQVVANGGMRINLQGEPVTPEGEAHAQERMARILAARAARGQQTTTPPVPVTAEPVKAGPTVMVKKRRKVVMPPP